MDRSGYRRPDVAGAAGRADLLHGPALPRNRMRIATAILAADAIELGRHDLPRKGTILPGHGLAHGAELKLSLIHI